VARKAKTVARARAASSFGGRISLLHFIRPPLFKSTTTS
jgi:hypothetical protein